MNLIDRIMDWIGGKVSQHPWKSILIAAGVGYASGAGFTGFLWARFGG